MPAEALRILVAEARPLVLASQLWEADLDKPALAFLQRGGAPIAVLRDLDVGKVEVEGNRLRFRLYPPWPTDTLLRQRLADAMPQAKLSCASAVTVLEVGLQGEQIQVLGQALAGTAKAVRLFYHPAVTLAELRRVVAELKPHVLHLVAHGDPEGHVLLEDGTGGARRVNGQVLSRAVGSQVSLFIDGSCHAGVLLERFFAQRGAKPFRAALGGDGSFTIPVRAVLLFGATLYPALASGVSLRAAFDGAVDAVRDDPLIGEAAMPDGAESETGSDGRQVDAPSPWKRFQRHGAPGIAFRDVPAGELEAVLLVQPSPHRRMTRDDELFVGRHVEIAALAGALAPPRGGIDEHKRRLVTLHGEGGIGKTRLAQAACEWLAERGRFSAGIAGGGLRGAAHSHRSGPQAPGGLRRPATAGG